MTKGTQLLVTGALMVSVLLIGVLDALTGAVPDLTVLYLVPIAVGTVYLGRGFGLATVVAASLVEVVPPLVSGGHAPSIVLIDGLAHLAVRALGVVLIDRVLRQLHEITELKDARDRDLEIAREVHESFFAEAPRVPDTFEVGLRLEFLREVGGDYYHLEPWRDGLFLCLADIAGKGVAAALFTVALNQSVVAALSRHADFVEVVESINHRITYALPTDRFVTLFACTIDSAGLTYTVAGHERPLMLRSDGPVVVLEDAVTMPLGISRDIPVPASTVEFGPGDMVLVVTDGVTDSPPFAKHPTRLAELFAAYARFGPQAVCDRIVEVIDAAGTIGDDVATVCIKRVASDPPVSP